MALRGIKVIEMAGLAPGPFCGMVLADFGASVIKIDRVAANELTNVSECLHRGKKSIAIDLKKNDGLTIARNLITSADALIEPYRPGVMEKLGIGPLEMCKINPKLVYARLSGYGQSGYLAKSAGHDINYVAISGILSTFGRKGLPPLPPLNLLADFAGGGLMCAFGIVLALYERIKSGKGQVIDANMVDGSAYVSSFIYGAKDVILPRPRGSNYFDGGCHFYDTYETKDGKYMAVGAIEPQFYQAFMDGLGLTSDDIDQYDDFEEAKEKVRQIFKQKTRDEWSKVFDGTDACVTPVLSLSEASTYQHNASRNSFVKVSDEKIMPAAAPKLSRTPGFGCNNLTYGIPKVGGNTCEVLKELGYSNETIDRYLADRVVLQHTPCSKL